jgi:hypothetical protein
MRNYKRVRCAKCNKWIKPTSGAQRFCGSQSLKEGCSYLRLVEVKRNFDIKHQKYGPYLGTIRKCESCGKPFSPNSFPQKYCGSLSKQKGCSYKIRGRKLRLRFLVLQKSKFACCYCGRKPPTVELQIDHIKAKSKGGENVLNNYIAACVECNLGKGDLLLVA